MRVTMRTQPLPQPGMVTQMPTADGVEYLQPAYADFPPQEHTARYARARQHMADQNLDALIVSGRENVYYFAGIHAYASEIQDVYVFCVVPQDASLGVSVITSTIYTHFASMTWVPDLRLWNSNLFAGGSETHPAVRLLVDVLAEKKLRRGRLGFELGDDISMGAGRALTDELVEALPDAAIVDGGPAIWATRKIKSPAEHAYMRKATEITAHGMRASMDALKPGMSEREVAAVMMAEWFRLGATDRGLAMVYAGDRVMSYDTYPNRSSIPGRRYRAVGLRLPVPRLLQRFHPHGGHRAADAAAAAQFRRRPRGHGCRRPGGCGRAPPAPTWCGRRMTYSIGPDMASSLRSAGRRGVIRSRPQPWPRRARAAGGFTARPTSRSSPAR